MRYYATSENLKYDFIVHPNANPDAIQLELQGALLSLENNEIHIHTSVGTVVEKKPFVYQIINGKLKEIESNYVLNGQTISFELGKYNSDYELIIDPEIAFSTYIGMGYTLDLSVALIALSYFGRLIWSIGYLPDLINDFNEL